MVLLSGVCVYFGEEMDCDKSVKYRNSGEVLKLASDGNDVFLFFLFYDF